MFWHQLKGTIVKINTDNEAVYDMISGSAFATTPEGVGVVDGNVPVPDQRFLFARMSE